MVEKAEKIKSCALFTKAWSVEWPVKTPPVKDDPPVNSIPWVAQEHAPDHGPILETDETDAADQRRPGSESGIC